jgi:hypothetical protein
MRPIVDFRILVMYVFCYFVSYITSFKHIEVSTVPGLRGLKKYYWCFVVVYVAVGWVLSTGSTGGWSTSNRGHLNGRFDIWYCTVDP